MELTDDVSTSDQAFAAWMKHVVIGILIGIPTIFVALYLAFIAVGTGSDRAWIISLWGALWTGVFAGGTVGAVVYALRHEH